MLLRPKLIQLKGHSNQKHRGEFHYRLLLVTEGNYDHHKPGSA